MTAQRLVADPVGSKSLAGVADKVTATSTTVSGVVTHVRGDHPTNPTSVGVWIQPDDGSAEIVVDSRSIISDAAE